MKKLISFIAASAILLNNLIAPLSVLAQEASPTPTSEETIKPTENPTPTPDTTLIDSWVQTPDVTNTPGETSLPTATDLPIDTEAPEGSPTTPGPPEGGTTGSETLNETFIENIDLSQVSEINSNVLDSGTITTDKPDYSPTSIVLITGSGFIANKIYTINVVSADEPPSDFTDQVKADESGNISYAYQLDGKPRLNYSVYIKIGEVIVASTTFTDPPPSANLDQCANGGALSPTNPCSWQNGNLNSNEAHYVEGQSVPYRVVMTNLPGDGSTSITLTLGYDIKHGDAHALDYLTFYNRLEPHGPFGHTAETVDPTSGIGGLSATTTNFTIPTPSSSGSPVVGQPTTSFNSLSGAEKMMTLFGGTITNITYGTQGDLMASQSETTINVTFTTNSETAVLSWGGHIASRLDWGDGNSAGGISGSPYHMRLKDWTLNNLGNQDRSLQAGAVLPPGNLTIIKNVVPGDSGATSWNFLTTGPNSYSHNTIGLIDDGLDIQSVPTGTYNITETTDSNYSTTVTCNTGELGISSVSVDIASNENVVCTFVNTRKQGSIELQKDFVGTPENVTIKIGTTQDGFDVDTNDLASDGTSGKNTVNTGTYYVSESLTNPSNYTSALACYDDSNHDSNVSGDTLHNVDTNTGAVSIANGDDVICVFTNTRKQGTVVVKKVMVGGTDTFSFTGTPSGSIDTNEETIQATVDTGQYTSIEGSDPTGWKLTDISCDDSNSTFDNNARSVTFNVEANETVTCTFTNTKQPLLTVTKNLVPSNDPGLFNLQIDNTTYVTNVGNGGTTGAQMVSIGNHGVGELAGNNTDLTNYNVTYSPNCPGGSITLSAGDDETCTITNTRKTGNVLIDKVVIGGSALASDWIFTILNVAGQYHDGDQVSLNTGSYTITESTSVLGYTLTSVGGICSNMSTPSATLTVGEQGGTCIFTNTRDKGSVKVNKKLDSDVDGTYELGNSDANILGFAWMLDSGTNNAMGITINNVETTVGLTTHSINEYNPGDYHFTGWYTNGSRYSCTTPEGTNLPVNINVSKDQLTEITFCNARDTGTIEIVKNTIGGNGTFGFTISGETGSTLSITTTKGSNTAGQLTVVSGIYSVSESDIPSGWNPTSSLCTDGEVQFAPTDFTVESGDHIVCTFTNTKYGYMQGRKYLDNNLNGRLDSAENGTFQDNWTINLYDSDWQFITSQLTGNGSLLEGQYRFDNLLPGTYYTCEVLPVGWQQIGPILGSHPVDYNNYQVNISTAVLNGSGAQNEAPICWQSNINGDEFGWLGFGNIEKGHIIVDKVTDPSGDPQIFSFDATGNGYADFDLADLSTPNDQELLPGIYSISEAVPKGWELTSAVCTSSIKDRESIDSLELDPGEIINCTFNNLKLIPLISIAKSNDKSGGASAGDTIIYTLTLTNDGNTYLYNIDVTDLLPGGFSCVLGSTTGATSSDPLINGGTLTWEDVGDLGVGESLTISYQAKIASDVANGIYTNYATCRANYGINPEGLYSVGLQQEEDTIECDPFANSTVPIGSVQGYSGNLVGQVLGISTELPATGNPTWVLVAAIVALGTGIYLNILAKKKNVKK